MVLPWFAVIDDHGRLLEPSLPSDQCGLPLRDATQALSTLDFQAVDAVRVAQSRAPEPVKTGCDQGVNGSSGADRSSGADPARPSPSALVCMYP
jgi:hypothetical protein